MGAENDMPFAGGWIDRDVVTRGSIQDLEEAWGEADATVLRMSGISIPVRGAAPARRLALIPTAGSTFSAQQHVYLGRHDGSPVFAESVADETTGGGEEWFHPFEVAMQLTPAERELIAVTSALLHWHESSGYSGREGTPTEVTGGGWSRVDERGGELFPRTDPAVIVLIEHEGKVLLGSNTLWESGRFSLLAGFVEAGETLEQTVAREIFEESGVRVTNIRYVASQPWPFPRSLMLGFRCELAPGQDPRDLVPDPQEISELRWFSRDEILTPPPGIRLPMSLSIASWLLTRWAKEDGQ